MIPILWRYAIFNYGKVFSLSVGTFVALLLVSRLKEIARFLALSSDASKTLLFLVYQIPTILPMTIPLSALIASFLLFQRLSRTQELTALRASGFSLKNILLPLCLISGFFSLTNFSICSELAPFCRRETKTLLYRETSANPLLLLQRHQLLRIRDTYLQLDVEEEGSRAQNFLLITPNESLQRLTLVSANELTVQNEPRPKGRGMIWEEFRTPPKFGCELPGPKGPGFRRPDEELVGKEVAIVSHLPSENNFDSLIVENQASMSTAAPILSASLKKSRPRLENNALDFPLLLCQLNEPPSISNTARIEILRRLSLSLSVFSFTLLGCVFGIEHSRTSSRRKSIYALFLTLFFFSSYLFGKTLKSAPLFACLAYFGPHLLLWVSCLYRLRRISRGYV
ncbi:MAG: LptF/LptG family permease [Verrucomicrobiota bacterium]|nr:LptF/LptG family permease [Verrucomicrobiota bacterium]